VIELLWAVTAVVKLACVWQLWQARAQFKQIGLGGAMAGAAQQSLWKGRRNTVFHPRTIRVPSFLTGVPSFLMRVPCLFRGLRDGLSCWHSPPKVGLKQRSNVDYHRLKR